MATFPIQPKFIKVLYDIQNNPNAELEKPNIDFLCTAGYLTNKFGGGWMITSKTRALFQKYRKNPDFIAIFHADWPHQLLAELRICEFNTMPDLPVDTLKKLAKSGYLVALDGGNWGMTANGRNLLRQYDE